MPELSLLACPVCHAQNSLSRYSRAMPEQTCVWYECKDCRSVLLWIGDGRWAYQKIGRAVKNLSAQEADLVSAKGNSVTA